MTDTNLHTTPAAGGSYLRDELTGVIIPAPLPEPGDAAETPAETQAESPVATAPVKKERRP